MRGPRPSGISWFPHGVSILLELGTTAIYYFILFYSATQMPDLEYFLARDFGSAIIVRGSYRGDTKMLFSCGSVETFREKNAAKLTDEPLS